MLNGFLFLIGSSTLGTTPGQTTAPTAGTTDSDSSDSEEELDSPLKIHQTPTSSSPQRITADSTTEKMDVDNSEGALVIYWFSRMI